MRKIDRDRIPAKVVLDKERLEAAGEIRLAIGRIHDAVRHLQEMQDFETPQSADPNDWQAALKKTDQRRDEALKAIAADMRLTQDGKAELAADWKEWHRKVVGYTNVVLKQITQYQECKFVWDSQAKTIVPSVPTMEVATAQATRDVPPEARDHALLLAILHDAVSGLREWEREHGVRKIRLEQLLCLSEEELAEAWVNGNFYLPTYQPFDTSFERSIKSVQSFIQGTFV
jgi:hypothetical protein